MRPSTSELAPKRKKVSKKLKSSWRKYAKVEDVEEFLEDQRLEERLGKSTSLKTDSELFTLDVGESKEVLLTSKQLKREMLRNKIPKYCSLLQPDTKTLIQKPKKKMNKKTKKPQLTVKEESNLTKLHESEKDIWGEKVLSKVLNGDEWFSNGIKLHTLKGLKKFTQAAPKSLRRKSSSTPAVEVPHPGTSYNPTFADHLKLVQSIVEKEQDIIKKEERIRNATKAIYTKIDPREKEQMWMNEMSEGLGGIKEEPEEEDDYDISNNSPVENKRKGERKRKRMMEMKKEEFQKLLAKQQKKKIADIYKLRFIKTKLEKEEEQRKIAREKRLKKLEEKKKLTKRLGMMKYEPLDEDFNHADAIAGNLRRINKEGNLLLDRFNSLQKRNILQPTTRSTLKRAKTKVFTKPGHKDDWKITVARAKPSSRLYIKN